MRYIVEATVEIECDTPPKQWTLVNASCESMRSESLTYEYKEKEHVPEGKREGVVVDDHGYKVNQIVKATVLKLAIGRGDIVRPEGQF